MTIWENGKVREATPEELKLIQEEPPIEYQIAALKQNLADTDYQSIRDAVRILSKIISALEKMGITKLVEDGFTEREAIREAWRDEINRLEGKI